MNWRTFILFNLFFTSYAIHQANICFKHRKQKRSSQYINIEYRTRNEARNGCECGKANQGPSSRIVGGTKVGYHEYPWLAMLIYNGTFLCGGTIVSDSFILTAGHCLVKGLVPNLLKVRLGEHDMCEADSTTSTFSVTKIIMHHKYNKTNFNGDIMLVKLNMRITFNKFAQPICLPTYSYGDTSEARYKGLYGSIIGWGKTFYGQPKSSCEPKKLKVPILDRGLCGGSIASTLFCAGYLNGEGDACQGDSGGPLQLKNSHNKYELIGIVSNGVGCALPGKPGLYTDVVKFLPWIIKHTLGSEFCD